MRITIIGLPGSGKSTLARRIAEKLNIPHIRIDHFWFEAGGRSGAHDTPNIEAVRAHIKKRTLEAISADSWVSDGLYIRVQDDIAQRANMIIYLDVPLWRRLLNHTMRIANRIGRHAEVSLWDDVRFYREIIKRTFTNRTKIQSLIAKYPDKAKTLTSREEVTNYLTTLNS